ALGSVPRANQAAIGPFAALAQHACGLEHLVASKRRPSARRKQAEHAVPQRRPGETQAAGKATAKRFRQACQRPREAMPRVASEQLIASVADSATVTCSRVSFDRR